MSDSVSHDGLLSGAVGVSADGYATNDPLYAAPVGIPIGIPVSTEFDICDWNARYASTAATDDRSLSDYLDGFDIYSVRSGSVFVADDAVSLVALGKDSSSGPRLSKAEVQGLIIPESFTLEFDLTLHEDLPRNFEDPNTHLFVGVINQQGFTAGLLFSYKGIAITDNPYTTRPTILGGSADLLLDSSGIPKESVTLRVLVNGPDGRMSIYAADTSVAYATNSGPTWAELANVQLRYSIAAPETTLSTGDIFFVEALSNPSHPGGDVLATNIVAGFTSIRISSSLLVPSDKPIAVATGPTQDLVKSIVTLNGSGSYDKSGQTLEYVWDFILRPDDSRARLSGGVQSSITLGNLADDNELRITFREFTSDGDAWEISIITGGPNSEMSFLLDIQLKTLTIRLGADGAGVANTPTIDLFNAFFLKAAPGYDELVGEYFQALIVNADSANVGVLPDSSSFLTGGMGSFRTNPTYIPDIPGVYIVRLRVFNGVRFSSEDLHALYIQSSDQLVGHRPDSSYIWRYLPDFWKLVGDKAVLQEIWSAMTQVIGADMLQVWQHDFAKTIRDISRRFQRRWLSHSLYTEVTVATKTTLVSPTRTGSWDLIVPQVLEGTRSLVATYAGSPEGSGIETGLVLVRAAGFPVTVVDVTNVRGGAGGGWSLQAPRQPALRPRRTFLTPLTMPP